MVKIHKSDKLNLESGRPIVVNLTQVDFGMDEKKEDLLNQPDSEEELKSENHLDEIERILDEANKKAEAIVTNAGKHAIKIREKAYREGYNEGLAKAEKEIEQFRVAINEKYETTVSQLAVEQKEVLDSLEPELLELTFRIAEKTLKMHLARDDQAYQSLVKDALGRVRNVEEAALRVSSIDYSRMINDDVFMREEIGQDFELVLDNQLKEGSCIIESPTGIIDNSVSTRLDRIREAIRETLQ